MSEKCRAVTLLVPTPMLVLTKDVVVGSEEISDLAAPDRIHGARLEVHQNSARHVFTTSSLVKVDVDALDLQVRIAHICAVVLLQTMLVGHDSPELKRQRR